jgi:hypothetical protein
LTEIISHIRDIFSISIHGQVHLAINFVYGDIVDLSPPGYSRDVDPGIFHFKNNHISTAIQPARSVKPQLAVWPEKENPP